MQLSRFALAGAGMAAAALLAVAAPAQARIISLGKADTPAVPTCPSSPCLAVSRTTGYQVKVGDTRGLYTVPHRGKIVAWEIALGDPNQKQIDFFDKGYGEASAAITVLSPRKHLYSRVVAQSPVQPLQDYFGRTVQFPLDQTIDVKKGQVIALTVPTWAPALTQLLDDHSSWRASRALDSCDDTDTQTAQTRPRQRTQYRCLYTARLTYTATMITTPRTNEQRRKKHHRHRHHKRHRG